LRTRCLSLAQTAVGCLASVWVSSQTYAGRAARVLFPGSHREPAQMNAFRAYRTLERRQLGVE